jgi:hypothetical protein
MRKEKQTHCAFSVSASFNRQIDLLRKMLIEMEF